MPEGTYAKGLAGEAGAVAYLQKRGMVLLTQRYRSPFGEIDAVMADGETLVFVEVKARRTRARGTGLLAVDVRKQRKIIRTALQYLGEHDCQCVIRFDVVEWTADGFLNIPDAFQGSEFH